MASDRDGSEGIAIPDGRGVAGPAGAIRELDHDLARFRPVDKKDGDRSHLLQHAQAAAENRVDLAGPLQLVPRSPERISRGRDPASRRDRHVE